MGRPFQVMPPLPKGFVDGLQFLVVGVIVELSGGEGVGVEGDRPDGVLILRADVQDGSDGVVQGVGFNNHWGIGYPIS